MKMPTSPFDVFVHSRPTSWMSLWEMTECWPPSYISIADELPEALPTP